MTFKKPKFPKMGDARRTRDFKEHFEWYKHMGREDRIKLLTWIVNTHLHVCEKEDSCRLKKKK